MKNLNQMAYAADAAGLALRSPGATLTRYRGGAVSMDIFVAETDFAHPGNLMV